MPQGTHHYVITLEKPIRPGVCANASFAGTITPRPDATRIDIYQELYQNSINRHPELDGASVLFFSLEPNQL